MFSLRIFLQKGFAAAQTADMNRSDGYSGTSKLVILSTAKKFEN